MHTVSASHHQLPRLLQVFRRLYVSSKHCKFHARHHVDLDVCCLADEGCPGHILLAACNCAVGTSIHEKAYGDLWTAERQKCEGCSSAVKGVLVADEKLENFWVASGPQHLIKPRQLLQSMC